MHGKGLICLVLLAAVLGRAQTPTIPATGRAVPELAAYDNAIRSVMQKWAIPGASVAIADRGRLVYARGFGFADRERGIQVQPTSIFRLMGISKTLTGMAILRLVQDGKFTLDSRALDLIPNITPVPGATVDPRTRQITVRQLLQHTGGWAKEIPDDAVFQYTSAARALNVDRSTLTQDQIARFVISQALDFAPGTRYYYSQAGYLLLGRIIERVTGKNYEDAVKQLLLTPAGVTSFKLGRSLFEQKEPDEVRYYNYPGAPLVTGAPVVPGAVAPFERPYGGSWVEQYAAFAGWIGNAIDALKFVTALEGRRGPALLNSTSLAAIIQRPLATPTGSYTGLAWRITPTTSGQNWWHPGGASGTRTLLTRRQNNRNWVVLLNMRPEDEDTIITDLFNAFADAESRSTTWPTHDLFSEYARPFLRTSSQSLAFRHTQGGSELPAAQTVRLTTDPASAVPFTIPQPSARWLRLDRLTGVTPADLRVSVDPAGMEPGVYEGVVSLSAAQTSNQVATFRVTLTLVPAGAISAIRNSGDLRVASEAAGLSRLILEAPGELTTPVNVTMAGLEAEVIEVSGRQVEIVAPAGLATSGEAAIQLHSAGASPLRGTIALAEVAPVLYEARPRSPRAVVLRTTSTEAASVEEAAYACEEACQPLPIDLGPETDVVALRIPVTGTRSRPAAEAYTATIGDVEAAVVSVAPAEGLPGIDWVTVEIPRELAGRGEAGVVLVVAEKRSNEIKVSIR